MQLHNSTDHFGKVASSNVVVANEDVVKQVPYIQSPEEKDKK
jgi:hypothetical protein